MPKNKVRTKDFVVVGANIRGTPRMSAKKVRQDLKVLKQEADIFVTQEFKMDYYWAQAEKVLMKQVERKWASTPSQAFAFAHPVFGAQAVFWKTNQFKRIQSRKMPAYDFGISTAGIMDDRWIRAAQLEYREIGLRGWFGTTHFVVGGDRSGDSRQRRSLLVDNIEQLDAFLCKLEKSGEPIWFELDANINRNSEMYEPFVRMLRKHSATLHGEHGIEYCFTIDSHSDTRMVVNGKRVIGIKEHNGRLNTDHEARVTRMYMRQR